MSRQSERISDYELMRQRLKETDQYTHIEKSLLQFMLREQAAERKLTPASKETLKVVLAGLVEDVWKAIDVKTPKQRAPTQTRNLGVKAVSHASLSFDTGRDPQHSSRGHDTLTRHGASNDFVQFHKKPKTPRHDSSFDSLSKSLLSRSPQEALSLSDFCRIRGAGTFGKAQRRLNEETKHSPGPGAYKFDLLKIRHKSPRAVIPTATVKAIYEKPFTTPGPSAYYPITSALSKR
mmetsp:Transcript_18531/g.33461  ORF Transcript_18531/g.33461 Transcript_18531/m.33461 type:complete len:235 (-) Transcript_18531:455-1159(-)